MRKGKSDGIRRIAMRGNRGVQQHEEKKCRECEKGRKERRNRKMKKKKKGGKEFLSSRDLTFDSTTLVK